MSWHGRILARSLVKQGRRFATNAARNPRWRVGSLALAGGLAGGTAFALWNSELKPFPTLHAATQPLHQDNVISQTKSNALYLWISVRPGADAKKCAKSVAKLDRLVNEIVPPDLRDEEDEMFAGVGFGPNFLSKVGLKAPEQFGYPMRSGDLGDLPSTGGDIFVHAKSNTMSKLFELAQRIQADLPCGAAEQFQDIYGWVYKSGRDLSGFIDGTENPADDESRAKVAINKTTGGSFCITQKWVHDHETIQAQKTRTLEGWVGRQFDDSTELKRKPISSHVARMTTGADFNAAKKFEIVRQSQPYGTVGGESGLFFIGFAESPKNFEFMLDRMTGKDSDGHCDDVMRLSKCTQGTYWYFPSKDELKRLA